MPGIEMAVTGKDTRGALRPPSPGGQMEDALGLSKSSSYSVWMGERKEGGWVEIISQPWLGVPISQS